MPKSVDDKNPIMADLAKMDVFLIVNVRSRTKSYFQGQAKSLTSVNNTGIFDVLPLHANFITLINKYLIIDKGLPTEKRIEIDSAVVSVIGSKVDVYVGV